MPFLDLLWANSVPKKRRKITSGRKGEKPPFLAKCNDFMDNAVSFGRVKTPLCSNVNSVTIYIRGSDMGNNYISVEKFMFFY